MAPVTPASELSYHVSHEQFAPEVLLTYVKEAERAGFDGAFTSDHFHPWAPQQGHSGHMWSWLGAALAATERLQFTGITIPGDWRYHPALVAQGLATLSRMFPGRLPWFALGSGEALNERVVGRGWPSKAQRNARLEAGARLVRQLLRGERITDLEGPIPILDGYLWSTPSDPPRLVGAALSEASVAEVARWADGLLTGGLDLAKLESLAAAFRTRSSHPLVLKVDVAWASHLADAEYQAYAQWRFLAPGRQAAAEWSAPEAFERGSAGITAEDMYRSVLITTDPAEIVAHLRACEQLGFSAFDLHQVGGNQLEFLAMCRDDLLPRIHAGRRWIRR